VSAAAKYDIVQRESATPTTAAFLSKWRAGDGLPALSIPVCHPIHLRLDQSGCFLFLVLRPSREKLPRPAQK
jgi:hypothetical protein